MRFYIVDAFTEELFGGNPAGVVLLDAGTDYPEDEIMRKTAAELRYSETAFVKQLDSQRFQLRYFTPAAEVALCGHATIGTFTALIAAGFVEKNGDYVAVTQAGVLEIKVSNGFILMDMAEPELIGEISQPTELSELYRIMGAQVPHSDSTPAPLLPLIVSTGLPDIMMPVAGKEELDSLKPDFPALSKLSQRLQVCGVHAFAPETSETGITAYCRNFAPLYDIDEESATGTANGALTYYLYHQGLICNGAQCRFIQGEAMNRPSLILSRLTDLEDQLKIQVGGTGVVVAQGEINL